jgi:hypothetical protein
MTSANQSPRHSRFVLTPSFAFNVLSYVVKIQADDKAFVEINLPILPRRFSTSHSPGRRNDTFSTKIYCTCTPSFRPLGLMFFRPSVLWLWPLVPSSGHLAEILAIYDALSASGEKTRARISMLSRGSSVLQAQGLKKDECGTPMIPPGKYSWS